MNNYTYIMQHFFEYTLQGYETALGFFFYPLIISAIVGYVYIKTQSVIAFSVGVLLIFGAYGATSIFNDMHPFTLFLQVLVAFACTGLVVLTVSRYKRGG